MSIFDRLERKYIVLADIDPKLSELERYTIKYMVEKGRKDIDQIAAIILKNYHLNKEFIDDLAMKFKAKRDNTMDLAHAMLAYYESKKGNMVTALGQPPQIKTIWDNEGKSFDRYTVILKGGGGLGLSHNPESPQGFAQWLGDNDLHEGPHLGRKILWGDLPGNVRKFADELINSAF